LILITIDKPPALKLRRALRAIDLSHSVSQTCCFSVAFKIQIGRKNEFLLNVLFWPGGHDADEEYESEKIRK
jgi:hypothetical protein